MAVAAAAQESGNRVNLTLGCYRPQIVTGSGCSLDAFGRFIAGIL